MKNKIQPCACGNRCPTIAVVNNGKFQISCNKCMTIGAVFDHREDAIKDWNNSGKE